jgi:glycosyltransferase involved in cell wall biosynthesis
MFQILEGFMRILAITNLYPNPLQPYRAAFNRQQFRALAQRHEVEVISPIAWTDEWSARRLGAEALPADRRVRCDGLTVYHPRYFYPPRVLRHWYGQFLRQSIEGTFRRVVDAFHPDVVLAAWAYPDGWSAVELGRRAGLPVVVKVHGSDILTLARTRGRYARTVEAMRRADAVIAVSEDLADKVIEMGADRNNVSVIYDGIDPNVFCPGPRSDARLSLQLPENDPMILFVGNLVPVKGVGVLIEACARLAREGKTFRCFLIGQGPLRPALEEQIAHAGLQDVVTLVGAVEHARLHVWFRAADLFVLPSYSEGVPCVLLEAAACRTPYVASRVGGIPEIAHLNEGRLVPPGNVAALADAMGEMLSNPVPRRPHEAFRRSHDDAAREIALVLERTLDECAPAHHSRISRQRLFSTAN